MAKPATYLEYGLTAPTLLADGYELDRSAEDLDRRRVTMMTSAENTYSEGQQFTVNGPSFGNFYIDRVTTRSQSPTAFEHALELLGIYGSKGERNNRGYPDPSYNYQDWDTVEDEWTTTNKAKFVIGQLGTYGGTTVCVSANPKPLLYGYFKIRAHFVGIIQAKVTTRVITCDSQTVSSDAIEISLPGGWNFFQRGEVDIPKIVVEDTFFSSSPPPTQIIPGPNIPPNPPAINVAIGGKLIFVPGGDKGPTAHWPWGWKIDSLSGRQIGTQSLFQNTLRWSYQYQYTP